MPFMSTTLLSVCQQRGKVTGETGLMIFLLVSQEPTAIAGKVFPNLCCTGMGSATGI